MRRRYTVLPLVLALTGCTMGKDYVRPDVSVPTQYYREESSSKVEHKESIANLRWWTQFNDPTLEALIDEALKNNLDVKVAAARIEEAQAQVGGAIAPALPSLNAGVTNQPIARPPGSNYATTYAAAVGFGWDIDLWGRYRRAIEAVRANLAATEAARDGVTAGLVASVASSYFQLESLTQIRKITIDTIRSQNESLVLIERLSQAGVSSEAEVQQTRNLVASTEATLPGVETSIAQTESALSVLLGKAPGSIKLGDDFSAGFSKEVPIGLSSELLARRPDVRQAEEQLVAANATLGEAKAMFFPSFSLTGTFGVGSSGLRSLIGGGAAAIVSPGLSLVQPLFEGGALVANRDVAAARLKQADLNYRKTVLTALEDVSNALVSFRQSADEIKAQSRRENAARESLRLTTIRYRAGVSSYLDVLDSQRQLFAASTDLANARFKHNNAAVSLYLALGGGWQTRTQHASDEAG